jgi:mono/diheme cytochrome c family protein
MKVLPQFALFLSAVACTVAGDLPVRSGPLVPSVPAASLGSGDLPPQCRQFLDSHCTECHDAEMKKGGLDLTALEFDLAQPANFTKWVLVYDRVSNSEMPPKKKPRPEAAELAAFLKALSSSLVASEQGSLTQEGRSTQRRLNRYEYENALRDLLHAPWLQIRDSLPEDGEALRFNKVGDALDMSHVQMARYLSAADYALRQAMAPFAQQPESKARRYYARDQQSYTKPMKFTVFNTAPERATFPVLGFEGQPEVRAGKAPLTSKNPELRELEGVGVVASAYEPIEPKFNQFRAPVAGRYKLRFNAYSVWVGPGESNKWFIPNLDDISRGHRDEPITITAETPPTLLRTLGNFDVTAEPGVHELDVWLLQGETIRPDAGRLFRSRPGASRWHNPLAEKDGQPGVVFRWMEVEGPLYEQWPPAGHKLLFGDLPIVNRKTLKPNNDLSHTNHFGQRRFQPPPGVVVTSKHPTADAERLLREFIKQAYRHPTDETELNRFLAVVPACLNQGDNFTDAMIAAYTAVLCSPEFICLEEKPGRLDDYALASRLSFFLWNSPPDPELRECAANDQLHRPDILRAQTDRLLADPKSRQFVEAFLDYWLDLRKILATAPDAGLYPDYYLDDLLTESALEETRGFFSELLREDLPARNIITSEFAILNERLANHYGLPHVHGVALRRTPLPPESPRGGLMTQAAVLKVTANGTTTSPVVRGAWIMERILGQKPPPPPPSVPALDPDIRGAVTIRQQLDKHRSQETCAACHAKIDPAGFALENFDVMGGWRDLYRAEGGSTPEPGLAKSGQKFAFHYALPVDASGQLPDGRKFQNIRELKQLLLANEKQIARNMAKQLSVYATGAPVRFADRHQIELILERASSSGYGVRSLIKDLVQSELFLEK